MTPLSGYVGYALRRAQGVIFADFNHSLAELGLRPGQFAVLMLIDRNPGTSQSSVSAALGIQKANFVATIADLEKRGLVRRKKSEHRWAHLFAGADAARPDAAATCH